MMVVKHRFRLCEVPVRMYERRAGRSSTGGAQLSVYYMVKVLLAFLEGMFRRLRDPRGGRTMTPLRVSLAAAVASVLLLLLVVFELIRRRSLRERDAPGC